MNTLILILIGVAVIVLFYVFVSLTYEAYKSYKEE